MKQHKEKELKTLKDFVEPIICGGDPDDVVELVWRL